MKKQLKRYLAILLIGLTCIACLQYIPSIAEGEGVNNDGSIHVWDFESTAQAYDFELLSTVNTNSFRVENGVLTTGDASGSYMKAISKENHSVSSISVDIAPISTSTPLDAHILLGITGEAKAQPHQNDMIDIRWEDSSASANTHALKVYAVTENTRNVIFNQWIDKTNVLYTGNNAQAVKIQVEIINTKLIITVSLLSDTTKYKQYIVDITEDLYSDDGIAPAMNDSRLQGRVGLAVDGWNGSFASFDNFKIVEKKDLDKGIWNFDNELQKTDFEYLANSGAKEMSMANGVLEAKKVSGNSSYTKAIMHQGYDAESVSVDIYPGETEVLNAWLWLGVKGAVGQQYNTQGNAIAIYWVDENSSHNGASLAIYKMHGKGQDKTQLLNQWLIDGNNVYTEKTPQPINMKVDINGTGLAITITSLNNSNNSIKYYYDLSNAGLTADAVTGRVGLGSQGWKGSLSDVATAKFDNLTITEKEPADTWDFSDVEQANDFTFITDGKGNFNVDASAGVLNCGDVAGYKHTFTKDSYKNIESLSVDVLPMKKENVNQPLVADIFFGTDSAFKGNNYTNTFRLCVVDNNQNNNEPSFYLRYYVNKSTVKDVIPTTSLKALYNTNYPQGLNVRIDIKGTKLYVNLVPLNGSKKALSYVKDIADLGYAANMTNGHVGVGSMQWISASDQTARAQFDNLRIKTTPAAKGTKTGYDFSEGKHWKTIKALNATTQTVEAWVKLEKDVSNDTKGIIVSTQPATSYVDMRVLTYGRPCITWQDANGNEQKVILHEYDLRTGEWIHLATVHDSATGIFSYYVDGELVETIKNQNVQSVTLGTIYVGRNNASSMFKVDGDANQYPFPGKVANLRVWSKALTASEISSSMNSNAISQQNTLLLNASFDTLNSDNTFTDASQYGNHIELYERKMEWIERTADPAAYSMVIIPDQQILSNYHPAKLNQLYQWIADNAEKENIRYVLNVGDLADTEAGLDTQLGRSQKAYNLIKDKVPMAFVPGNHDYSEKGYRDTSKLNTYFPLSMYEDVATFGGSYDGTKTDNTWHEFEAYGNHYLILALEFGPRDSVLDWAGDVIAAHPNHQVIVITHAHMSWDATLLNSATNHCATHYSFVKGDGKEGPNDAQGVWDKLIKKHKNIIMTISGHVSSDDVVYRIDKGEKGNDVIQMLIDGQGVDADYQGAGFLGIMRFDESGKQVDFEYFSPINEKAFKTCNQFHLTLPTPSVVDGEETKRPTETEPEEDKYYHKTYEFESLSDVKAFDYFSSTSGGYDIIDGQLSPTGVSGEFKAILNKDFKEYQSVSVDIYPEKKGVINAGLYLGASDVSDPVDGVKGVAILLDSQNADNPNQINLIVGEFPWKSLDRTILTTGYAHTLFDNSEKEPLNLKVDIDDNKLNIKLSLLENPDEMVQITYLYDGDCDLQNGLVGLRSFYNCKSSFDNFTVTCVGQDDIVEGLDELGEDLEGTKVESQEEETYEDIVNFGDTNQSTSADGESADTGDHVSKGAVLAIVAMITSLGVILYRLHEGKRKRYE